MCRCQFITVETLATAITDLFPQQLRGPRDRVKLTLLITVVCFLLGLPFVTEVKAAVAAIHVTRW